MPRVIPCLLAACLAALAQSGEPVFKTGVSLQSVAVRVTDKQGTEVRGLTAADFTVLEDNRPQKIAFFGAESQPISLLILLDSSSSMKTSSKLAGAWKMLEPLAKANMPEDEVFLAPFTEVVGAMERLAGERRASPPAVSAATREGGTALYDALATGLCHMRSARNIRQAVVVITDGSDQHSRLRLDQLIQLAQTSKPQIFMVGFFGSGESETFRQSGPTVKLVSGREIDNPLRLFDRIAKETGAESYFPKSLAELQQVIARILGILQTQYTVAYYPQDASKYRRIQVKVSRVGAVVEARHSAGSEGTSAEPVRFVGDSCQVSPAEHPYPWETHVTEGPSNTTIYREDFANARSGWPNHPGSRYVPGGYELHLAEPNDTSSASRTAKGGTDYARLDTSPAAGDPAGMGDALLAAYGPWFRNFRASLAVEGTGGAARGMVFRLGAEGCYILLISGTEKAKDVSFRLLKKTFWNHSEEVMIPWTHLTGPALAAFAPGKKSNRLGVECWKDRITLLMNGEQIAAIDDLSYPDGYVGMAQFGFGRTLFHDLRVEGLP